MTETLKAEISNCASCVEFQLKNHFSSLRLNELYNRELSSVVDAAEYSIMAGGKRLRPFLVFSFAELCGCDKETAMPLAIAIESVHTYSLIHDDLPCMDNDDFRRGKPTNHKVFGEATAVLAGDALLTEAFSIVANCNLPDKSKLHAISVISEKSGMLGMIGGQEIDLRSEGKAISLETLKILQRKKTGMLFEAACLLGCISAGHFDDDFTRAASEFAHNLGLAFQITDDILDVIGSSEELGKSVGSDEKEKKSTFVTQLRLNGAKKEAEKCITNAKKAVTDAFGGEKSALLCELCDYILIRRN